jgi:hypothetical protein
LALVTALCVFDDGSEEALFVAGGFGNVDGLPATGFAKWNGTQWSGLQGTSGVIWSLAVFDDGTGPALFAGGDFTNVGPYASYYVAKWNGSWFPGYMVGGTNPEVRALGVFDDGTGSGSSLYLGTSSAVSGGVPINGIGRWTPTQWLPVGGGVGGTPRRVYALTAFDDESGPALYVGGTFTEAGGLPANRIAVWRGCAAEPPCEPADLNGDCTVDGADLLILLSNWG